WRSRSLAPLGKTARALDYDTLLLLFSLFILLEGVSKAGVIDAAARLFHLPPETSRCGSISCWWRRRWAVGFHRQHPLCGGHAAGGAGGRRSYERRRRHRAGAVLFWPAHRRDAGRQPDPIGASANIAAIGILRKNGECVRTSDFLRIGVPFTLAAVLVGAGSLWLFWGV
ncbi:MAG: arsenic transporter, partial [Faecalibacterium sp.]